MIFRKDIFYLIPADNSERVPMKAFQELKKNFDFTTQQPLELSVSKERIVHRCIFMLIGSFFLIRTMFFIPSLHRVAIVSRIGSLKIAEGLNMLIF